MNEHIANFLVYTSKLDKVVVIMNIIALLMNIISIVFGNPSIFTFIGVLANAYFVYLFAYKRPNEKAFDKINRMKGM